MASTLKRFKDRALSRPAVKKAYDELDEEFAFLDEVLRARAEAGLTQAEVAALIGTTQSAVARLESAELRHSPSIATLQRYARALGYRVQIRLVKDKAASADSGRRPAPLARQTSAGRPAAKTAQRALTRHDNKTTSPPHASQGKGHP
jgi:transcriptional regulator with XRE-family HTH domain